MAILHQCNGCRQYFSLKRTECPKCLINISKSNKFRINVPAPDRSRITKSIEGNLTIARNYEAKIKAEIAQEKLFGIKKAPFVGEIWGKYIEWAKGNKKSWEADYSRWKNHLADQFSQRRMNEISKKDVLKILDKLKRSGGRDGKGAKPATIKQVLVLLRRLYNWSKSMDLYANSNPTDNIKVGNLNNKKTECLSLDEIKRLQETLSLWHNQRAARVVKFALYTGLRLGEILNLKWQDVDMNTNFVTIKDPKGKPTVLPLNQSAWDVIEEALKDGGSDIFIFPNRRGEQRKSFAHIWYRIRKKAELPSDFRFHGLRHTFASHLASSGKVDIYTLQKLLNHQSPAMTQRYAHLLDSALKKGADVLDDIY